MSDAEARTVSMPASSDAAAQLKWLFRRMLSGVLVLFVVSILIFVATQALPSDPAQTILGRQATPELLANLREQLGLNRPLPVQYVSWLGGLLTGDLGVSIAAKQPVVSLIGARLLNSLALLIFSAAILIPLSIAVGVAMAVWRNRIVDRSLMLVFLSLMALPDFVIGTILLISLATLVFQIFPAVSLIPPGQNGFGHPYKLVLPVLTGVLITAPYLIRQMRAAMIEALESEYVVQARLRGINERRVVWRHALPNALVPMVQGSALMLSYLLGGVVVIEYIYNYPGLGGLLNDAVRFRDLPVLQAVTLIFATGVVIFNIVADLLTILLTPRLRTIEWSK
ncbi:ABC transporter permease (plasmid) [Rhizobium sp. CB3171]|uniref:ABC transporter permease n=1 Tax=unclassified Rhizobium TaxID=2613769 RepID=UPI001FDEAB1F|nr:MULTISPECIES: ABC transporter permease [Rhizobium]UWU24346.1 ABC transporter permease [Rhizobium tropici]WFU05326.1 ABC transporter permease [Rhizobium sp. CB3171]